MSRAILTINTGSYRQAEQINSSDRSRCRAVIIRTDQEAIIAQHLVRGN